MSTRNVVPRADGEGGIGTFAKAWNEVHAKKIYVNGEDLNDGTPVGRVVLDVILRTGYIKANGATVADASIAVPRLLAFVQANSSLLAVDAAAYAANVGLYLYDSNADELTLPNYIDRFIEGGNSVASVEAGLPNVESGGSLIATQKLPISATSAFYMAGVWEADKIVQPVRMVGHDTGYIAFDMSRKNSIYGNSITVQPKAVCLIPQIRY